MKRTFFTDTIEAEFYSLDGEDYVELSDGFTLDTITTVTVDNEQWTDAFGTDQFYRFTPIVAKPIVQEYVLDDEHYQFKKDEDELKQAQWQIDNLPWTVGHPSQRRVTHTDEIRGFWRNPVFADDGQRAKLYVPDNDDEALEFIVDNPNVSVMFGATLDWTDDAEYDAVQRDMLYDHIASVKHGRCSRDSDDGPCGIQATDDHAVGGCSTGECSCGLHDDVASSNTASVMDQAPSGVHVVDGEWFAVGPDEHTKDSTDHPDDAMYPVTSCADVEDAWRLRNHGEDLTIEQSTLHARIKRAGEAMDCDIDFNDTTMTDPNDNGSNDPMFSIEDMKASVVVDEHDGVAELIDQKEAKIDSLESDKESLESELEDLRSFKDEYDSNRRADLVDEITDITDYWEEDVMLGHADDAEPTDIDILEERLEALSDASTKETTPSNDEETPPEDDGLDLTDKGTIDLR